MLLNKIVKMSVWCLLCFPILMDLASTREVYGNPSSDFSKHSIVKPKLQHGRTKRDLTCTKNSIGSHHPEVTLTVSIDGEEHELELRLNEALVPRGHALSYQQGGQTRVHAPGKEELDICQYSGRVRGKPGSWAAVSTCRGVRGVVYDGRQLRYIEPVDGNEINADHFLYSHEHLTREYHCGNPDGGTHNSSYHQPLGEVARKQSRRFRYKRNAETATVQAPSSANQRSRYVELVLVVDHSEYVASGRDLRTVHNHMKDLANIINSVYAPLNIFIALVGVEVWTTHDEIIIDNSANETLHRFSGYRSTVLVETIPNDNAHLITGKTFNDGIVGRAFVSAMCSKTMSAGVASNHSRLIGLVAMTVAHEMGHNFGMHHDQGDCKCPDEKCIMSSTSNSVIPERWSSCSLQSLSLSFEKGLDHCLRNEPKQLFESPTCGNGFLEKGEQCDCGMAPGEYSPGNAISDCHTCCKPDCTLRADAICAHGQCCDITTCRPKAIGTECRAANRECDLPEFCNGTSPVCPSDVQKMDATPCGKEKAYCVRGVCRSHTDQCRLLWGVTGESSDDVCYSYNDIGVVNGNCGYNRATGSYLPCAKEDVFCGRLQCSHHTKDLEYSSFETATVDKNWANTKRMIFPCHTAIIDLGASVAGDEDPGLVPDGAKCGPDKMCMQQRCLPVKQVQEMVKTKGSVCPSDCSGHGVCNSNGNCHCEAGYAPPLCALSGAGGSYDAGPIVDNTSLWRFMVAMYVIFLGIVPALALVLFFIYCCRCHGLWWKKQHRRCGSKFTFNSFGKMFNDKVTSCNNTVKAQNIVGVTKHGSIEEHVNRPVNYDVCNKNVANSIAAPITNNTNIKEPIINRKQNEDIVVVENCLHHAPIHKNLANLDVQSKPKVNAVRKTFESLGEQTSTPQNFKDLNKELSVLKHNKSGSPINRPTPSSTTMPKPNLSPKPGGSPKTSGRPKLGVSPKLDSSQKSDFCVSPKPSVNARLDVSPNPATSVSLKPGVSPKLGVSVNLKPSVSPKPYRLPRENGKTGNPKPEIMNVGLVSTTNEFLSQRSKLRNVGDIKDVNK